MALEYENVHNNKYKEYKNDENIKLEDFIVQGGDFVDSKAGISLITDKNLAQDAFLDHIKVENVNQGISEEVGESSEVDLKKIGSTKIQIYPNNNADIKLEDFVIQTVDFLDSKAGIPLLNDNDVAQGVILENTKVETSDQQLIKVAGIIDDCEEYNSNMDIKLEDTVVQMGNSSDSKAEICWISDDSVTQSVLLENIKCEKYNSDTDIKLEGYTVQTGDFPYAKVGIPSISNNKVVQGKYAKVKTLDVQLRGEDSPLTDNQAYIELEIDDELSLIESPPLPTQSKSSDDVVPRKENNETLNFQNHYEIYARARSLPFNCKICKEGFLSRYHLSVHQATHSSQLKVDNVALKVDGIVSCEQCGKSFDGKIALTQHIRSTHFGENGHVCSYCGKRFSERVRMMCHIKKHTNKNSFTCDVCKKTFAWYSYLKIHMRAHTTDCAYFCDSCPAKFKSRQSLVRHTKVLNH